MTVTASITLTVDAQTTRLKVPQKSDLACYGNPLATKRALYLSTVPSDFLFTLNSHLQPTSFLMEEEQKGSKCYSY